jgi:Hypothetical glycosyl hydrolase family 15
MNSLAVILIMLMEHQTLSFDSLASRVEQRQMQMKDMQMKDQLIAKEPVRKSESIESIESIDLIQTAPLPVSAHHLEFHQLKNLNERIKNARYPRIGQSWSAAENVGDESIETSIARHGLYFAGAGAFQFQWKKNADGGESSELELASVEKANKKRSLLLEKNPNLVLLSEIRYYDALPGTYPTASAYWQHDSAGNCLVNNEYSEYNKLNYANVDLQTHVAQQAFAVVASGAVDGVMLDWWSGRNEKEQNAKLQVLQKVRQAIGPDAVIIINTNESMMPVEMTKLVNGYFMECYKTGTMQSAEETNEEWRQIQKTLTYSEQNGRAPHVNMVETWWNRKGVLHRNDLSRMRATTAMVMTQSDGYALFADPNQNGVTNGHEHNWYPFWNVNVGKPIGDGHARDDGSYVRAFEKATVLSNATGEQPTTIKFDSRMKRTSNNDVLETGQEATIEAHDGEIFLNGE